MVPTDLSTQSRSALRYALALARQTDGYVVLLHVIPPSSETSGINAAWEQAGRELAGWVDRHKDSQVHIDVVLKVGAPWRTIVDTAHDLDLDMIILSTHGRDHHARHLVGGVTEKVVRMATCPVLTVPGLTGDDQPRIEQTPGGSDPIRDPGA